MNQELQKLVAELNSSESFLGGPSLKVGSVYRYQDDGRLIRIVSGQYLSGGRISNHWKWEYLTDEFEPTGETEYGYGWSASPVENNK